VTTQDFIAQLRRAPDKPLLFVNADGDTIQCRRRHDSCWLSSNGDQSGEIRYRCWSETVMQLWVPDNETSETFMTADKFLRIYEKVSCMIDVDPAAEVRFEYGDENFFPSNYHVDSVIEETDALRVELRPPQTTCKARDRRAAGASCCC
jgi:hypothetical protein